MRVYLGDLLFKHVRNEFPALIEDIERLLMTTESDLRKLGPPRSSQNERRQYLLKIATSFQLSVKNALAGNYERNLGKRHPLKLRMLLHSTNEAFAERIHIDGHTRRFENIAVDDNAESESDSDRDNSDAESNIDQQTIYDWIRDHYHDSRGAELPGSVNPTLLQNLFFEQTVKWQIFAEAHLNEIDLIVGRFCDELYRKHILDERVRNHIIRHLKSHGNSLVQNAREELRQILADEREGILQTVNHYYADTLTAIRQQRLLSRLKQSVVQNHIACSRGTHYTGPVDVEALGTKIHLSNQDQAIFDIHDILKAYYKVAKKRFVDNIVIQLVERCYIKKGPLTLFTPEFVVELQDDDLQIIASEDLLSQARREELSVRKHRLEQALILSREFRL